MKILGKAETKSNFAVLPDASTRIESVDEFENAKFVRQPSLFGDSIVGDEPELFSGSVSNS